MKENVKKIKIKRIGSPTLITCPVCGFTYRAFDSKSGKRKIKCPICGYNIPNLENFKEFRDLNINFNLK